MSGCDYVTLHCTICAVDTQGARLERLRPPCPNSSTAFFDGIGDLIRTRPTLTNVANVRAILIMRAAKIAD
jgi:glycerate-2-kinase